MTVYDYCAGLTYSQIKPEVTSDTNNFKHFEDVNHIGSGDSVDDPWVYRLQKSILTDPDVIRLEFIDYYK